MKPQDKPETGSIKQTRLFSGKNRRFYALAASMLALILAPFGLYAALGSENGVLSALFFAVIAGTTALVAVLS